MSLHSSGLGVLSNEVCGGGGLARSTSPCSAANTLRPSGGQLRGFFVFLCIMQGARMLTAAKACSPARQGGVEDLGCPLVV